MLKLNLTVCGIFMTLHFVLFCSLIKKSIMSYQCSHILVVNYTWGMYVCIHLVTVWQDSKDWRGNRYVISPRVEHLWIQWNLSKQNHLGGQVFFVQNRQVFGLFRLNKQRLSSLGLYFKFGLYRIGVSIQSFF